MLADQLASNVTSYVAVDSDGVQGTVVFTFPASVESVETAPQENKVLKKARKKMYFIFFILPSKFFTESLRLIFRRLDNCEMVERHKLHEQRKLTLLQQELLLQFQAPLRVALLLFLQLAWFA